VRADPRIHRGLQDSVVDGGAGKDGQPAHSRRVSSRRTFTTVLRSQGWTTGGTKTHRPAVRGTLTDASKRFEFGRRPPSPRGAVRGSLAIEVADEPDLRALSEAGTTVVSMGYDE
jgi:hypothetical protein